MISVPGRASENIKAAHDTSSRYRLVLDSFANTRIHEKCIGCDRTAYSPKDNVAGSRHGIDPSEKASSSRDATISPEPGDSFPPIEWPMETPQGCTEHYSDGFSEILIHLSIRPTNKRKCGMLKRSKAMLETLLTENVCNERTCTDG